MNKETIEITHCNPVSVLNVIKFNKIHVDNCTIATSSIMFTISRKYHNALVDVLGKYNYQYSIINYIGWRKFSALIKYRLGLVVGTCICLIASLIFGRFTFYINVLGLNTIARQEVIQTINKYGVSVGKINHFDNAQLEKYILSNIDKVSLVSVTNRGNTITINIKEKLSEDVKDFDDIIAPMNMLITSIDIVSGTAAVSEGNIVKKGEILVFAYYLDNAGLKHKCDAIANIKADTWFCATTQFKEDSVTRVRTGKVIKNSTYYLGGKQILQAAKPNNFKLFVEETREVHLFNRLFLPLVVKYNCI